MKLKEKIRNFYNENKTLMIIAILLNVVFTVVSVLSICGLNIAEFSCSNTFLIKMNAWLYSCGIQYVVAGLIFASNIYFMIAICSNDYGVKPLLFTACLLPVFIVLQYVVGVNAFVITALLPLCVALAYNFKFSTLYKGLLFYAIVLIYQYIMRAAKLSIFGISYLTADILTYILLSIDLYIVFIFYFCICRTIYKNKLKKEE